MATMGPRSATELLQLPVQLHGIRLGRPVDLLLDPAEWRALGFVVLCGDESSRFLAFAAADLREDAIHVSSAFLLLEDVEFYRARSRSLRDLLRAELRDLLLASDGSVEERVLQHDEGIPEIRPVGVSIEPERVSTA
jgi:hypothetical protein